jgi:prevent-host-death family protein
MAEIGINEARTALSRLVDRVQAGEEIVITRRGKPAVKLVPVEQELPPRKPGAWRGKFVLPDSFFDPLPDEIIEAFYESKIFPDEERGCSSTPTA